MKYRCVECGHEVERLYIQYSPGNIRLVKCSKCMLVADKYIECELIILMIDLILHKPKAYRHLLFNLIHHKMLERNALLFKSSLIFFALDAYKLWILKGNSQEYSNLNLGAGIFGHALLGNLVFLYSFFMLRKSLEFVEGFSSYKEVLLAIIVSCYLKIYMLAMLVWDFPFSAVYITDLFVMSSNLVALRKQVLHMESQKEQTEVKQPSSVTPSPNITSCRRKKNEDATFLEDVKDHIDEFISASIDEHKSCFTKTIQKMFGMSKAVAQRTADQQEIESILPLQTTISK